MKCRYWFLGLLSIVSADDLFNYRETAGSDYGPQDWDRVDCPDLDTCPGWPVKLLGSEGWRPSTNQCEWCPIDGNSCGQHRQSPIDLNRDRAIEGNPNEKECVDWHWIQYLDGTCGWDDMDGQFEIGRHALMIHTPLTNDGDINCVNQQGERKFPKLDYSKGFPDWWYLSKTEISVPSEHVQHGKRYAAEVKLSHFYEIDHYKNKLGVISFFMQDFEGEPSWPYLDKLICRWRREEEEKRVSCGLPPAPVYKMCELYRGQTRTADDFEAPTQAVIVPTRAPLVAPPAIPIVNHGGDPEEFRLPLGLCEGDCDFMTDCAPGLICYQRDALDAVPGCLGGETDSTNTDYCVFDPYGPGYSVPTAQPTNAPSITARPTLTPLDPIPLVDYGGTPPLNVPLKLCEGDCDKDEDCDLGLVCFQRTSYEPVPGCIGGTTDMQKTDYCVFDIYGPGYVMTPGQNAVSAPPINQASGPTMSPTVFSRPLGEPIRVQNLGWEPPIPLGECAGDCDTDEDCGPGMYCYQRNSPYENVPGCLGGDEDPSLTDYCAFRSLPTTTPETVPATPTIAPTVSPTTTIPSTSAPVVGSFPSVTIVGWSPSDLLNECEGDCDEDTDCSPGLVCFQRNRANVNVPGCLGGDLDKSLTDYCIKNPNLEEQTEESGADLDVTSPTNAPILSSPQPSESSLESTSDLPPIKDLGWTPPSEVKPLGLCEGDCDIRQDCGPGLDCYQRYLPNLPVPGCSGGELDDTLTDYCVPIEMMNTNQVLTAPDRNRATAAPEEASIPEATPTSEAISQTTEAPQMQPTDAPILQATAAPVVQATTAPAQTLAPVENRFDQPTIVPGTITGVSTIPPIVSCDAFPEVNFFRMCKDDSCCTNPRSTSDFCQETYELLGDATESSCDHCCLSEQGKAQQVGPAPEANPQIPKLLQCTDVEQPNRICSEGSSCCDSSGERSSFCQESYARYSSEEIESICWYCCFPSKILEVDVTNRLLAQLPDASEGEKKGGPLVPSDKNHTRPLGKNDRLTHDVGGRPVIVRAENFEEKGMMDEEAYFEDLFSTYRRRALQQVTSENYDDVFWWPYEWFLKVGTEYYFRYEGTQTVPPCYDTAHWRVFKDPIRVAAHQMRELERLIAWRHGDDCQVDTAGKPTDSPNVVDVARPLQSTHRLHRKVFCECKDWPSKFPADRQWCRNWQNKPPEERLMQNPYNFPSNGFEFL